MSAVTSALLCLIVCFLVCSTEAQENITAELGQDVTLTCKADNNKPIIVVEWSRLDLDPPYVLLYRDERFDSDDQHPSYKNRVDLKDKEMKDGDVSLVLKNVTENDTGRYKCYVLQEKTMKPICAIYLIVHPPGDKDGGDKDGGDKDEGDKDVNTGDGGNTDGIIAGPVVVGLILLAVLAPVGFLIYKILRRQNPNFPVPPDDAAAEQIL